MGAVYSFHLKHLVSKEEGWRVQSWGGGWWWWKLIVKGEQVFRSILCSVALRTRENEHGWRVATLCLVLMGRILQMLDG